MNQNYNLERKDDDKDEHEHDMVMPGFRFHPTEEELVEFYLRRMVEGKRFNVELITFIDLYRYDPWELPGMSVCTCTNDLPYPPQEKQLNSTIRPTIHEYPIIGLMYFTF